MNAFDEPENLLETIDDHFGRTQRFACDVKKVSYNNLYYNIYIVRFYLIKLDFLKIWSCQGYGRRASRTFRIRLRHF